MRGCRVPPPCARLRACLDEDAPLASRVPFVPVTSNSTSSPPQRPLGGLPSENPVPET